ncbi:MAG: hypothetical protein JXR88_02590 [Clostridia bacterium]|nr:hypothetical protein [Clostridia bacterium]
MKILVRIFISLIGLLMIIYFVGGPILYWVGDETFANVTSFRREGGEMDIAIRNTYKYGIGYEFTVNGQLFSGTSTVIGDSIYVKGSDQWTIVVKYLKSFPKINLPKDDTKFSIGNVIGTLLGLFVIYAVNQKNNN